MSSGFISEAEIAEQRRMRQEEWERVRRADQPLGYIDDFVFFNVYSYFIIVFKLFVREIIRYVMIYLYTVYA